MINVLFVFLKGALNTLFKKDSKNSIAFKKLIATSFIIPEKNRYSFKTIISQIFAFCSLPILQKKVFINSEIVIYDINNYSKSERLNYLKHFDVRLENLNFISAEDLTHFSSVAQKIGILILFVPVFFLQCILGIFIKDKSGISRLPLNLFLTHRLKRILKSKCKKIYIFSVYDTNSAFLSLNLMLTAIHVTNIASEVPLYKWNKQLVCNKIHLCSFYQEIELKHLTSIKYDAVEIGMPERAYQVSHLYKDSEINALSNTQIGFISTGGWVRNKLGHINQGTDIENNEIRILKDLNDILAGIKELKLIVYPHPREVSFFNNNISNLTNYYKEFLSDINFTIENKGIANNFLFNDTKLSICYLSTIIFERAYFKRYSAITYFKDDIFPLKFEHDYLKTLSSKDELRVLIKTLYNI